MSPENVYIVLDGWINTLPTLGAAVSVECWSNRLFYLSTPRLPHVDCIHISWRHFLASRLQIPRESHSSSHWLLTLAKSDITLEYPGHPPTNPPTLSTSSTSGYPTQLPTYLYIFAVPNISDTGQGTHFIQPTICFLLLSVPQLTKSRLGNPTIYHLLIPGRITNQSL